MYVLIAILMFGVTPYNTQVVMQEFTTFSACSLAATALVDMSKQWASQTGSLVVSATKCQLKGDPV